MWVHTNVGARREERSGVCARVCVYVCGGGMCAMGMVYMSVNVRGCVLT